MAGLDRMYDTRADIEGYIEHKIREILEEDLNELQDPNWVQAAILFKQVVVPCEDYMWEYLYDLAKDIVTKAEKENNRVVYRNISPRLYNQEVVDSDSIDLNNVPDGVDVMKYDSTINAIKKWMKNFSKVMAQFKHI